jgi:S1-C subfamily serine protease
MLNKLKEAIKNHNYLASLARVSGGLLLLAGLFYVGANAPQWHLNYLEAKVGKVVIKVVKDEQAVSGGTGFHVKGKSGKTYILTNAHVCGVSDDGKEALIQIPNSDRFSKRKIIEVYKKHDLCLIEALDGYEGIEVADNIEPGDNVRAVGHPRLRPMRAALGEFLAISNISIATAELGSMEEATRCEETGGKVAQFMFSYYCIKNYDAMETTVTIFPGSSGSPLVNFSGNLVGVIFAGDNATNYGFAVPLVSVKDFLSIY